MKEARDLSARLINESSIKINIPSSTYQMQGRIPLLKIEMYNTCFKRHSNDITAHNRDLFRFCVC